MVRLFGRARVNSNHQTSTASMLFHLEPLLITTYRYKPHYFLLKLQALTEIIMIKGAKRSEDEDPASATVGRSHEREP
jgi:hypothetical protein